MDDRIFYSGLAAAAVRGYALRSSGHVLPAHLAEPPLECLGDQEITQLMDQGRDWGVKLYRFKRGHETLPRVKLVLGFLKGIAPESLMDVGSGRGVFLFPFLEAFPETRVMSLDILPHRAEFLEDIRRGGVSRLTVSQADICSRPVPDKSFDVVTMLEVLEHIPDVQAAVTAAVQTARRYVVATVPSKPDNNPEHIHLLTETRLTEYFECAGCKRLHFNGVHGHLALIAALEE